MTLKNINKTLKALKQSRQIYKQIRENPAKLKSYHGVGLRLIALWTNKAPLSTAKQAKIDKELGFETRTREKNKLSAAQLEKLGTKEPSRLGLKRGSFFVLLLNVWV